ncbi:receptor-type tyrosine-protein phosphatase mu-like isoform X1 [Ostrea edulis]|uniref:receptor-type tyrosine-protein phosphatase mu-like isoform X1 n=1 Tax=Ostrea edulis TaxID=37623 RepID=UPI0024AF1EB5|nr:receptor-type tyrosine-protein phosphatase mu-like isoform X1 [Ostrea edulis]
MESRNSTPGAFWKTKNKANGNKYTEETPDTGSLEEQELTVTTSSDGGYYNIASVNSCIRVEDLQRIIAEKNRKENNIFAEEYKILPTGNTEICRTAQRPENVSKNRFKTTFPYEHSRVVLEEKWNPSDNDYINANYIKDNDGNARFIAAQGPKKTTLKDFWRMMWQGNIKTVVMLTNIVENGKNKCSIYWADKDEPLCIGPCTVTLSEEVVYSFYVVRKLCVQNKEVIRKRTITQYHYTAWPDHGTPEEISLNQFHRAVLKTHQRRSPLLVHCSAGVGRTGTFIALDTLLEEGRRSGEVDVLEFVKSMREDRMTMVQTVEQYVFLHKALLDGLQGSCAAISESDFQLKAKDMLEETFPLNQRQVYCEFKKLLTLKPVYDDEEKEDSKTPENLTKNVSVDILPVSKHRPYLATYIKGRNDYINAVIVPSFTNPIGFILTQKPLVDTEVDLWRMCMDHDTDGIVVLNDKDEENIWVPSRGSSRTVPPFNITAKDTGSTMNDVIQGVIGVSDQDRHRSIDTFQLPAKDDKSILKGIELLLEKTKSSTYRTIVMSTDGAGAAGIFCAVHNAVQELRRDGEIDLFTIVRQIHVRRPEVIGKLDEYRRCYSLLMTLLEAQGIYANL